MVVPASLLSYCFPFTHLSSEWVILQYKSFSFIYFKCMFPVNTNVKQEQEQNQWLGFTIFPKTACSIERAFSHSCCLLMFVFNVTHHNTSNVIHILCLCSETCHRYEWSGASVCWTYEHNSMNIWLNCEIRWQYSWQAVGQILKGIHEML